MIHFREEPGGGLTIQPGPPPVTCDTCGRPVTSFVLHTDQQGLARPGPVDFELRPCGHRSTATYPPGGSLPGMAVRDRP